MSYKRRVEVVTAKALRRQRRNLHTESDALHDEDSVRKDCSHFLHAGKILDGIPDVSVFIQQLELPCRGKRKQDKMKQLRVVCLP